MSTHSIIGIKIPHGSFLTIYCHNEGGLEHNGEILSKHYNDVDKITALIHGGDISILGSEIGEKHSFDERVRDYHRAEWADWTLFYHRDREEPLHGCKTRVHASEEAFIKDGDDCLAKFVYLWDDGKWGYLERRTENASDKFQSLKDALENINSR